MSPKPNPKTPVEISTSPTVTSSGHIVWSVRDILFSPSRKSAADIMGRKLSGDAPAHASSTARKRAQD
jgi:hypothetical protein